VILTSFVKKNVKQYSGLLDLYQKEKEKNKELKEGMEIQEHNYKVALAETVNKYEIKAKIEEIEKELSGMTIYLGNRTAGKTKETIQQLLKEAEIKVLQELLEGD
jgi:hypothetical protein